MEILKAERNKNLQRIKHGNLKTLVAITEQLKSPKKTAKRQWRTGEHIKKRTAKYKEIHKKKIAKEKFMIEKWRELMN